MPLSAPRPAAEPAPAVRPVGLPAHHGSDLLPQRLVALSVAFALLVNFPLLALWDHPAQVMGLPLFPLALFMLWGLFIATLAWLLERRPD